MPPKPLPLARLLFPAIRWDRERGYAPAAPLIDDALALGVGGFILFGGEVAEARALTLELRRRAGRPLLIGADLERGAGQQFRGATALPPAAALGRIDDLGTTRRAAELTAREARALGINWIFAPVADLDIEPRNPIVGTRAFGGDARRVALHVQAWVRGCHDGGALACVKHFPGHGRTTADSHLGLPVVDVPRRALESDLAPFAAGFAVGADSVMTAHVAYPALDAGGGPATLSRAIVTDLLRMEMQFTGVAVTDALVMQGARADLGEAELGARAVAAGCDALLYPGDLRAMADGLDHALGGALPESRAAQALARVDALATRADAPAGGDGGVISGTNGVPAVGAAADRDWALDLACRTIMRVRGGTAPLPHGAIGVCTVDDDVGGPYAPPSREPFQRGLAAEGRDVLTWPVGVERAVGGSSRDAASGADRSTPAAAVIALYADVRGWKGRPGISERALESVRHALDEQTDAIVVLFGHPRLAGEVPGGRLLVAWGGEAVMQEAAARVLVENAVLEEPA